MSAVGHHAVEDLGGLVVTVGGPEQVRQGDQGGVAVRQGRDGVARDLERRVLVVRLIAPRQA